MTPLSLRYPFLSFLLLCSTVISSRTCRAEGLDGYLATFMSYNHPLFSIEHGTVPAQGRINLIFEAGRLSQHIALDFRLGYRSDYTSYGSSFRLFQVFNEHSSMLMMAGVGLGMRYSPGFPATASAAKVSFVDALVNPFVRIIFDTRSGIGPAIDLGMEFGERSSSSSNSIKGVKSHVVLAVGGLFDWDGLVSDDDRFLDTISEPSDGPKDFSIGFKIGLPYSVLSTSDSGGTTTSGAFSAGFVVGTGVDIGPDMFGLMGDLLYAQRSYGTTGSDLKTIISRFEMPVRLRVRASKFLFGTFGGYLAYGLGSVGTRTGSSTSKASFASAGLNRLDFGVTAGGGGIVSGRGVDMSVELRYLLGMRNLKVAPTGSESIRNSAFDLIVGIMF